MMVGDCYQRPADELLKKYLDYSSAGAEVSGLEFWILDFGVN